MRLETFSNVNEGVQLSITHACLYGVPNWGGIITYLEKLFSRRKSSAEKTQFDLFCKNLPTPLKKVEEQERVDFPRLMKELETAIRKFSKMMIEHEMSNSEVVCKHILASQQKKLTIEKHSEERKEEIKALQELNAEMGIDEIAVSIGDWDPNFQKGQEILKAIEKITGEIAELGSKKGGGFLSETELVSAKGRVAELKSRNAGIEEGIGAIKETLKRLKTKVAVKDKGEKEKERKKKMIEEKEASEKTMKELLEELKSVDGQIEQIEAAVSFSETFDGLQERFG